VDYPGRLERAASRSRNGRLTGSSPGESESTDGSGSVPYGVGLSAANARRPQWYQQVFGFESLRGRQLAACTRRGPTRRHRLCERPSGGFKSRRRITDFARTITRALRRESSPGLTVRGREPQRSQLIFRPASNSQAGRLFYTERRQLHDGVDGTVRASTSTKASFVSSGPDRVYPHDQGFPEMLTSGRHVPSPAGREGKRRSAQAGTGCAAACPRCGNPRPVDSPDDVPVRHQFRPYAPSVEGGRRGLPL